MAAGGVEGGGSDALVLGQQVVGELVEVADPADHRRGRGLQRPGEQSRFDRGVGIGCPDDLDSLERGERLALMIGQPPARPALARDQLGGDLETTRTMIRDAGLEG